MAPRKAIGILLPVLNAGYDMEILAGAHAVLRQHEVQLIAVWGSPSELQATSLASERIDGWIAIHNVPRPTELLALARTGVPLVAVGALASGLGRPAVLPDNYGGTLAAVRHLLDHGHQRIAFLGDLRVDDMRERYAAYEAALTERGIPVDPRFVFGDANYYSYAIGGPLAAQQLIVGGFPCSAIVAGNDLYALEVIRSVQEAGYRIPEDLAVVGFDDLAEAQYATPPLTTVHQSYAALGRVAAELILAQLAGQEVPAEPTYVPTKLMIRRSCGCAKSSIPSDTADVAYTELGWQATLAQQLAQLVLYPRPFDPATPAERVWPGMALIIQELETTLAGTRPIEPTALERAWREAVGLTANLDSLDGILSLLEHFGEQQASRAQDSDAAQRRLREFLGSARLELMRAQQTHQLANANAREELVRANYAVSMALLDAEPGSVARLAWLSQTPLHWACLGMWAATGVDEGRALVVTGTYSRDGEPALPIGAHYPASAFPPPDVLPAAARAGGPEVIILLPIRTAMHDWGILAVCRPTESRATQSTDEDARIWATLLGAALEREALLKSLVGQQNTLGMAYEQQLIVENIRDLIFMIDQSGRFLYASPAFQHVLGYSPSGLLGFSAFDLIHPEDVATVQVPWTQVRTQSSVQATFRFRHADGSWRWLEVAGTIVMRQGLPVVIVVGRDVTERKHLEAQVLQSQKIESIGQLAGGVAHDFNNLLTAINGYAELILESLPSIDPIRSDLEEIRKAAQRATNLTSQLLSFARKQIIEPRVLRLNDLILDMNRLLRRLIGENIELVTSLDPGLSRVKVDSGQFEQVLVNLAINARDAMPNGGQLWIGTVNTTIDHTYARTQIGLHPGAYVQLSVRDTGVGMDARVQAHLFEPFFTTKGPDKGTGLGLATCYGIVRQHNGQISIQSEVGQGTTVTILLPPVEEISIEATRQPDKALPARSAEIILLAEDEDSVRSLVARVLRGQGYTVLEAGNGVEALRLAREYAGPIDLLLTDVVMPQLGGTALAVQLAVMRPGIKTLFMSGYTDRGTAEQGSLGPDAAFLMKPFTSAALAHKVRSVLDA